MSGRRRRRSTNPAPPVTIWTLAGLLKHKEYQVHPRYLNLDLGASARYTVPRLEKWRSEIAVVNKRNLHRYKRSVEATMATDSSPVHWHLDAPACTGRSNNFSTFCFCLINDIMYILDSFTMFTVTKPANTIKQGFEGLISKSNDYFILMMFLNLKLVCTHINYRFTTPPYSLKLSFSLCTFYLG